MAWESDPRRVFIVGTIAGAIAPAGQKVSQAIFVRLCTEITRNMQHLPSGLQDAYAQFIAKDDTGAIAAFLEDASTNILQVCFMFSR